MIMDDNYTFERICQDKVEQYDVLSNRIYRATELLDQLSKSKSCPLGNGALEKSIRILRGQE